MGEHRPQHEGMQALAPVWRQREGVGCVNLTITKTYRIVGKGIPPRKANPVHVRDCIVICPREAKFPAMQTIQIEVSRLLKATGMDGPSTI